MALKKSNHVFKGYKALLGGKFVTYGELELPLRYDLFEHSSSGFDWGHGGAGAKQLSCSILYQLMGKDFAEENYDKFTSDIIKRLNAREWILESSEILSWIAANDKDKTGEKKEAKNVTQPVKKQTNSPLKQAVKKAENEQIKKEKTKQKTNVVKDVCTELNITQKKLAQILEVPEGTVSSWAVKNEIPRLGKKAIEFYIMNHKNQQIVDTYKNFAKLLNTSSHS